MRFKRKYLLLAILIILLLFIIACSHKENTTEVVLPESEDTLEEIQEEITPTAEIQIAAVGDIMVHGPQITAQYNAEKGEHDFVNNFQFVKSYLKAADLAIGNLETTFGGTEAGYSGYPMFNAPDALADALKKSGFNVIVTANNHTVDTGASGMLRTIEVLENRGLKVIGTREKETAKNYLIEEIEGIKVALTAYTYETPRYGDFKTLNGLMVPREIEELINTFSYEFIEKDLMKMEKDIQEMKADGAEIIVFYLHWGEEYQRQPNQYQKYIAEKLAEYGVDIILGSHPHVIQPIEFIESSEGETLVVYSMGNFISNQRYETLNNRYTEDGIILNIKIKKDFQKENVRIEEVSYIPTWVHRYMAQGRAIYEIIPVGDALEDKSFYHINNDQTVWRVNNSKNNTIEIIESEDTPISIEGLSVRKE